MSYSNTKYLIILNNRQIGVVAKLILLVILAALAYLFGDKTLLPESSVAQSMPKNNANQSTRSWSYIDTAGNLITDQKFDTARDFSEGLAAIRIGDRVGYIDRSGTIVIEPIFCDGGPFTDGLAYVSLRKDCYHISVYESEYIEAVDLATAVFGGGVPSRYERMLDDSYGFIDSKGTFIVKPRYTMARSFREGYALVAFKGIWRYIDKQGNFLSRISGGSGVPPTDFSQGFVAIPSSDHHTWLFLDKAGNVAFSTIWTKSVDPFSDGFAKITGNSGVRYVGLDGKYLGDGDSSWYSFKGGGNFSEGLVPVKLGNCWVYISKTPRSGEWVRGITTKGGIFKWCFKSAQEFSEGLAAVEVGKGWGFIDKAGEMKIPPTFKEARKFSEGLAAVKSGEKWGYIGKDGKFQINPSFRAARDFSESRAAVKK